MRYGSNSRPGSFADRTRGLVSWFDRSGTSVATSSGPDLVAMIVSELLTGADAAARGWWQPKIDPEPEPETGLVYDGSRHYRRVTSGWQANDGDEPVYTWSDIPAPLLVDVTHPRPRSTSHKPDASVADTLVAADQFAITADQATEILQDAIRTMEQRSAAGEELAVAAGKWTAGPGPIWIVWAEEDLRK